MNDQYGPNPGENGAIAQSSFNDTKNLNEASSPEGEDVYNDSHVESRGKQMASESLSDLNDSQLWKNKIRFLTFINWYSHKSIIIINFIE